MPSIPIAQSTKKIQPQAVAPRVTPGQIPSAGKDLADLGEVILNVEESVRKISNLKQVTEATTAANVELDKVNSAATQDERLFENQQGYYNQIDEVGKNASQGIQDPETRLNFEKSFSTRRTNLKFSIGKEARRNLAATTKQSLNIYADNQKLAYNQSPTFEEREMVVKQTIAKFDAALADGLITTKQYKDMVDAVGDDFEAARIEAMIESNPPAALETMVTGQDNFSSADLKKEYRAKSEKAIEKMTAEGQVQLVNEEDQTEINDIRLLTRGQLTNHIMNIQEENRTLLPDVRELLEENMLSPVAKHASTDSALFGKLLIRAYDDDLTSKDARLLMTDVIRSNTLGKLSRVDTERIIGRFSAQFQDDANKRERNVFLKAYRGIKGFFKRTGLGDLEPELSAQIMRQLIDDVNTDKLKFSEIDKRKNELIKEVVKQQRPSTSNLPDVPNSVANSKAGVRETFEAPTELKASRALKDDRQFSQEDIEFTAQQEGITVDEVLKRLGASKDGVKSAGKPKE